MSADPNKLPLSAAWSQTGKVPLSYVATRSMPGEPDAAICARASSRGFMCSAEQGTVHIGSYTTHDEKKAREWLLRVAAAFDRLSTEENAHGRE